MYGMWSPVDDLEVGWQVGAQVGSGTYRYNLEGSELGGPKPPRSSSDLETYLPFLLASPVRFRNPTLRLPTVP